MSAGPSSGARTKKIHRVPILIALIAVLVAAIVFDSRESSSQTNGAAAAAAAASVAEPSVPSKDAVSTSWYCAEGTSTPDGRADETILIASVADTKTDATVTVMPGGLTAPVSRTVHLEPRAEARVHLADVSSVAEPGVVVEVAGGQAVVAHELAANGDIATEPCARGASSDWYFANGTTLKGASQYIALFNPFGDDAIVDVTFLTDDGVQQPDTLQALSVPRRSRVSIPVSDILPRQREVAVQIHARSGRVVAERSQLFDGTASDNEVVRQGIGLSLGAQSPRREWYFPYGTTADGATGQIGLANFGSTSATVEVNVVLDGDDTVAPQSVEVPARGVTTVDASRACAGGRAVCRHRHRTRRGGALGAHRRRDARNVVGGLHEHRCGHFARIDPARDPVGGGVAGSQRRGCHHGGEPRHPATHRLAPRVHRRRHQRPAERARACRRSEPLHQLRPCRARRGR